MVTRALPKLICRFGPFVLDLRSGDLTRNGRRIRLQERPRSLLLALAERPEELITRAELHEKLWPQDTFVDFEDGLNAAMSKLREALGDNSQAPRYIETVRKRGYRFVGASYESAEESVSSAEPEKPEPVAGREAPGPVPVPPSAATLDRTPARRASPWLLVIACAAPFAAFATWWSSAAPPPRLIRVAQITTSGRIDFLVKPVSDGARVFYLERDGGHWNAMQTSLAGGDPQPVPGLPPDMRVMDISPDRTTYLLGRFAYRGSDSELFLMPVQGGAPVRLGDIVSGEAVWHPDGRHIVYGKGMALWIVGIDGTHARMLTPLPGGPNWLAWSPDGRRLRLTLADEDSHVTLWELNQDGSRLHRVFPPGEPAKQQCCGEWTPDGRYFIFTATRGSVSNLWAQREPGFSLRRVPVGPFQITDLPDGAWGAHVSPDGRSVLFYAGRDREQIERLDAHSGQLTPVAPEGFSEPEYSHDGKWLVYVDSHDGGLWRATADGTQRIPLSLQDFWSTFPRWSPDGRWLAVTGSHHGDAGTVYLIPSNGGSSKPLLDNHLSVRDPDWSPDGSIIVVGHAASNGTDALFLVDFASRKERLIPGSENKFFAHWSPNGRFLSAYADDARSVAVFDFEHDVWKTVLQGTAFGFPNWSHDSRYLYFQKTLEAGQPIYRLNLRSGTIERVADFRIELASGIARCTLLGLAPDDAPLMAVSRGSRDLYRADLSLPR